MSYLAYQRSRRRNDPTYYNSRVSKIPIKKRKGRQESLETSFLTF